MGSIDVNRLFTDVMMAVAKHPALANALFGAKQGARIAAAIGDPVLFQKKMDELTNHSQGFAQQVSDARIEGFNGAVSRFEGSVKTLESAIGQAFDANGRGGFITGVMNKAVEFTQALAEAPPELKRLAVEAGAVAGIFGGLKATEALLGGFGLKSSAVALTEAAAELKIAAGEQMAGARGSAVAVGAGGAAAAGGMGLFGKLGAAVPWAGGLLLFDSAVMEGAELYKKAHPEEFKNTGRGPIDRGVPGHWEFHPTHSGRTSDPGKVWVPDDPTIGKPVYGPFLHRTPYHNRGDGGHLELDQSEHYRQLSLGQQSLNESTSHLKVAFTELNASVVNLAASFATAASFNGGSGSGGLINASYETGGDGGAASRSGFAMRGGGSRKALRALAAAHRVRPNRLARRRNPSDRRSSACGRDRPSSIPSPAQR